MGSHSQRGVPRRRRAVTIFAVGAALVAGSALTAVTVAGPASAVPDFVSAGPVTLSTGASSSVTFGSQTQMLATTGKCELSSSDSILAISAAIEGKAAATVGFLNGSLGVAEKPAGTSCYEANSATSRSGAETLVLSLVQPAGGLPLVADSASLDLELKGTAEVAVTAKRAGAPVATLTLASGADACTSQGADSGPDAREGDNCYFEIDPAKAFDTLVLTAQSGAFSLEGGSDWPDPSAHRTTFDVGYVADESAACGPLVNVPAVDGKPAVTITRLHDVGSTACSSLPYTFAQGAGEFTFLKPASADNVQFVIDVTWTKAMQAGFSRTQVKFESAFADLPWCDPDIYDATDAIVGVTAMGDVPDMDSSVAAPGTQYACLDTSNWKVNTKGTKLKVTEKIYLLGDVIFRG